LLRTANFLPSTIWMLRIDLAHAAWPVDVSSFRLRYTNAVRDLSPFLT
jgi:hypothetical protein